MHRKCKRCGETKCTSEFSSHVLSCKPCIVNRNKEYWQTPKGRMSYIYSSQIKNSKERNHPTPDYSREQLTAWAYENNLEHLVNNWKLSNYSKRLAPSVDRLDPNLPYTMSNIRLVTWEMNNDKAYQDRKSCFHVTRQNKKVEQLSVYGKHIAYYDSISSAARSTGAVRSNINAMCVGKPHIKSVSGFIWRYADCLSTV